MIHLAEVVELSGNELSEARKGWRPQYVATPWLGDNHFADLEVQGSVEKTTLIDGVPVARCTNPADQIRFGAGLGRHRWRFAFPDDLTPTLKPIISRLRDKAGKATPQGRRIDEIEEIRARASPDWDAASMTVELVFLINSASLPSQSRQDDPSSDFLAEISGIDTQKLAERLDNSNLGPVERNALWQRLADSWVDRLAEIGLGGSPS